MQFSYMRQKMTLNHFSKLHSLFQCLVGRWCLVPSTDQSFFASLQQHVIGAIGTLFTTIILKQLQKKTVGVILQELLIGMDDVIQIV